MCSSNLKMKCVLLTHLDHNKVVKIPEEKDETDIAYLKSQFRRLFSYENHVVIDLTFQRYDPDWETYIDLDDDEVVENKEKLKVIVTPTSGGTSEKVSRCNSVFFTFLF